MFSTVYIGSDYFSAIVLENLIRLERCEVRAVGTYPDKPHGRGHKLMPTPVKFAAQKFGLPVIEIADPADTKIHSELRKYDVPIGIMVSFRIVPPEFLKIFERGFINLHPSLLPDLRGAAPIQWAIMNGYKTSGITTFIIDEKVDSGNILMQRKFEIGQDETTREIFEKIAPDSAELLVESIEKYLSGEISPSEQSGKILHKAPRIKRKHQIIHWDWNSQKIHNRIRGLSPTPGALAKFGGKMVKILRSKLTDVLASGEPGEIAEIPEITGQKNENGIAVNTADKVILLTEIQPAGKKIMKATDFARGYLKKSVKFEEIVE